ncbi:MAG TPA: V-type ATPase subunit [Gallionella sp.]|nr:V-type ATPase subunit [Gallionella sp.]
MSATQYAYLHARVSLYAKQLLGVPQLDALIDRPYDEGGRDAIQPAATTQYTGDLDQKNVNILLSELAVLVRPLSGAPRELLDYWAHRFELGNLKTIIRGKMSGQPQAAIEAQLQDMGRFTSLPIGELLQSDSPAELLRRLEQTPYSEIAQQARHLLDQGEALFALDAALDRRYFAGLARHSAAIADTSAQLLHNLVGSIIDRVNLVWLLRYRYAYSLPPAQAYYLLIPANHRLQTQQLQQLAQCASFDDATASLPAPFDRLLAGVRNPTEVTLRLEQESWRFASHALNHSSFNVARALAYLMLRERDLRRLRAIVRGRNMHMDAAMIRTALGLGETGQKVH